MRSQFVLVPYSDEANAKVERPRLYYFENPEVRAERCLLSVIAAFASSR